MRILIAEDDPALAGYLARGLCSESDEVELAQDGDAAVAAILHATPDLLLLDLDLPGRTGFAVLAAVRELSLSVPVLVLSGRAETETRIHCLELGADDCMTKPFSLRELRARCAALRRRLPLPPAALLTPTHAGGSWEASEEQMTLTIGCLSIRRLQRQAEIAGAPLLLTNREFALLEQLALAAGVPVERSTLVERIWHDKPVETNALDVHLGALRKKLGRWPGAPQVLTVRGRGFRLAAAPAPANDTPLTLPPLPLQKSSAILPQAGSAQ